MRRSPPGLPRSRIGKGELLPDAASPRLVTHCIAANGNQVTIESHNGHIARIGRSALHGCAVRLVGGNNIVDRIAPIWIESATIVVRRAVAIIE